MRSAASMAAISPTAWSDLEAGKHPPLLATQRGVALALDWPTDWLDHLQRGQVPHTVSPSRMDGFEADLRNLADLVAKASEDTLEAFRHSNEVAARLQAQVGGLAEELERLLQVVETLGAVAAPASRRARRSST